MYFSLRLLTTLLAATLVAQASSAHAAPAAPVPAGLGAALQSEYDAMNAALAHGDLTRYLSYHTADYSETDPQGQYPQCHGRAQDQAKVSREILWIKHFDAVNHVRFHYRDTVRRLRMSARGSP